MHRTPSKYNIKLNFNSNIDLNKIVNKETISRYLYDGSYARPGTKHFLNGYSYQNVDKVNIQRNYKASLSDIEDQIRLNIRNILSKNKKISLLITSGLDSYLLYLIFKSETKNFNTKHDISFITGRFDEPYDEYSVLKGKRSNIKLDKACTRISTPDEALELLKGAVSACDQPVNGLVASAVYKAIMIASEKNSVPILGTGETIFFTSTFKFINEVNSSVTRSYSADKTIQIPGNFLTDKGVEYAKNGQKDNQKNEHKIFKHKNKMEQFIHNQQFWIDAPRVDYEVSSYCKYFNVQPYTPLRDPQLLELFLNLPEEEQHDGRPKTVIKNLITSLEGRDDYPDGFNLKMTSPQREYLRNTYKDGGFAELVDFFISNSILARLNIVDISKLSDIYSNYKKDFDKSIDNESFSSFSSYNIWKFFITELWLNQKIGRDLDIKKIASTK